MTKQISKNAGLSRRDAMRWAAIGGIGLWAPNLLGRPAFGQTPQKPAGRVVVGMSQEPTVLNPLMVKIEGDDGVHFSLFDALVRVDPKGVIRPNLAVEVPTQQNGGISEDGLQWRVRLRDDVRWHDGGREWCSRSRVASPDAYEVSCRVRVGEHPAVSPIEIGSPASPQGHRTSGARNWVPRPCRRIVRTS